MKQRDFRAIQEHAYSKPIGKKDCLDLLMPARQSLNYLDQEKNLINNSIVNEHTVFGKKFES